MRKLALKQLQGLSAVECLVCCTVLGLLLSRALPGMREFKQRQYINGVAETVRTDLMQARSEAMRLGESVHVRFDTHPAGTCYLLYTGDKGECACDKAGSAACSSSARLIKSEWIPLAQAASVKANVGDMTFSGYRGTASPTGSIDIAATNCKATIRHVVALTGRVRSCSPDRSVSRLKACG